jgi:hypothetical protein
MKIAIFYHCLFYFGDPPDLYMNAVQIVASQMAALKISGLEDAASEIVIGINGGSESEDVARTILPYKAKLVFHGLQSKSENMTIRVMEKWLPTHEDWLVLYFHSKGATHDIATEYGIFDAKWRECMMTQCVDSWRRCVADLEFADAVGCHWLTGQGWDHSQHYFAGTFFWARASFLRTLPSIMDRERIKISGLASAESRYEAEVWIGNGPRLPIVRDYHPGGIAH